MAIRTVMAQTSQFPDIGRMFYESGPAAGHRRMVAIRDQAVALGDLEITDTDIAAYQLVELCRAELFHKLAFGVIDTADEEQARRVATAAVTIFLQAYGAGGGNRTRVFSLEG
jgi:TetR/AcrR family transcriptional regulator, mexJK operon transcriptional repressor